MLNFVVLAVFEQLKVEQSIHSMTEYEHRTLAFFQAFLLFIEHRQRLLMVQSLMELVRKISKVEVALAKLSMEIRLWEQVQFILVL